MSSVGWENVFWMPPGRIVTAGGDGLTPGEDSAVMFLG